MSEVHEAMDHALVAGNGRGDARLQQPLPVFFSSISQWITLGSDDECWWQSMHNVEPPKFSKSDGDDPR